MRLDNFAGTLFFFFHIATQNVVVMITSRKIVITLHIPKLFEAPKNR
jgi:hypothetical protein